MTAVVDAKSGTEASGNQRGGFPDFDLNKTLRDPKVFIVVNTTSYHVEPTYGDETQRSALKRAGELLNMEKEEVLTILREQGYSIDDDCIIENGTTVHIISELQRKIESIPEDPLTVSIDHDSLLMWFIGIESSDQNEIIYTQNEGLSIDRIHHLFKSRPGIDKFIGKPKLFFFLKLQGIKRTIEKQVTPEVPTRLPVDADFWTCLVNIPFDERQSAVTAILRDYMRRCGPLFQLDDLMYDFKSKFKTRWPHTRLPMASSTLRHDIFLEKTSHASVHGPTVTESVVTATDEESQLNEDMKALSLEKTQEEVSGISSHLLVNHGTHRETQI